MNNEESTLNFFLEKQKVDTDFSYQIIYSDEAHIHLRLITYTSICWKTNADFGFEASLNHFTLYCDMFNQFFFSQNLQGLGVNVMPYHIIRETIQLQFRWLELVAQTMWFKVVGFFYLKSKINVNKPTTT